MNKQLKLYGIIALICAGLIALICKNDIGYLCAGVCLVCSFLCVLQAKKNEDFIEQIKDQF